MHPVVAAGLAAGDDNLVDEMVVAAAGYRTERCSRELVCGLWGGLRLLLRRLLILLWLLVLLRLCIRLRLWGRTLRGPRFRRQRMLPVSTSALVVVPVRKALSVASVAATGTAKRTMSAPDTASSAEGASTSMTPIDRARSVVEGDLL